MCRVVALGWRQLPGLEGNGVEDSVQLLGELRSDCLVTSVRSHPCGDTGGILERLQDVSGHDGSLESWKAPSALGVHSNLDFELVSAVSGAAMVEKFLMNFR